MLLLQQEGRQKTQHGVLGDVNQEAFGERTFQDRLAGGGQLQRLNRAHPADFHGDVELVHQLAQLLGQVPPDATHLLQQVFVLQNREILQRDAASQRATAESCPVLARSNVLREPLLGEKRPQRQSGGDGLGNANYVGHDSEVLEGEELPGTPESALKLVEDGRGLVLVGQLAARLQKFDEIQCG